MHRDRKLLQDPCLAMKIAGSTHDYRRLDGGLRMSHQL
jgi:hypothetical protein